jgi:hypothetical protein
LLGGLAFRYVDRVLFKGAQVRERVPKLFDYCRVCQRACATDRSALDSNGERWTEDRVRHVKARRTDRVSERLEEPARNDDPVDAP